MIMEAAVAEIMSDEGYLSILVHETEDKVGSKLPPSLLRSLLGTSIAFRSSTEETSVQEENTKLAVISERDDLQDKFNKLKTEMEIIRKGDVSLLQTFLAINDKIEELKWLEANYELTEGSRISLTSGIKSREKINLYGSKEFLHGKWIEKRSFFGSRELISQGNSFSQSFTSTKLSLKEMARKGIQMNDWESVTDMNARYPPLNKSLENYMRSRRQSSAELLASKGSKPRRMSNCMARRGSVDSQSSQHDLRVDDAFS